MPQVLPIAKGLALPAGLEDAIPAGVEPFRVLGVIRASRRFQHDCTPYPLTTGVTVIATRFSAIVATFTCPRLYPAI